MFANGYSVIANVMHCALAHPLNARLELSLPSLTPGFRCFMHSATSHCPGQSPAPPFLYWYPTTYKTEYRHILYPFDPRSDKALQVTLWRLQSSSFANPYVMFKTDPSMYDLQCNCCPQTTTLFFVVWERQKYRSTSTNHKTTIAQWKVTLSCSDQSQQKALVDRAAQMEARANGLLDLEVQPL